MINSAPVHHHRPHLAAEDGRGATLLLRFFLRSSLRSEQKPDKHHYPAGGCFIPQFNSGTDVKQVILLSLPLRIRSC